METLLIFICMICAITLAVSIIAVLDGYKKAGGIIAAISAVLIALSIYGIINIESYKTDEAVSKYKAAVKAGYAVYYNGNLIEGDKIIVNRDTIYTFIMKYDKDKKQILVMSKYRTRP